MSTNLKKTVNLKIGSANPKTVKFQDVKNPDPKLDLKHNPENKLEEWALGSAFKITHQAVDKTKNGSDIC